MVRSPSRPVALIRPHLVAAAVGALLAVVAFSSPATGQSAQGGSISGTVTDQPTGAPLQGICVYIYPAYEGAFPYGASTDDSGNYSVGELPTGDYNVGFFDECDGSVDYMSEWYHDRPDLASADPVAVQDGQDTSGVDAALNVEGSITGTVTDELTGAPPERACISALDATTGESVSSATAGPDGRYRIGNLHTSTYAIHFSGCAESPYFSEFFNDKPDQFSADPVSVTVGQETGGIDAALTPGGFISGVVTDEATGERLFGICVSVSDAQGNRVAFDLTSGSYFVGPLRAGEYFIHFFDTCGDEEPRVSHYIAEWFDDAPDRAAATPVTVTPNQVTTGIDAALTFGGWVSGTVTDEVSGDILPVICITLYDAATGNRVSDTFTGLDGTYTVGALRAGNYAVRFSDGCDDGLNYLPEFYDNRADLKSADAVSVTLGEGTLGVDAALARPVLTVQKQGKGSGTVSSDPVGIDCGLTCQAAFDAFGSVTLIASAAPGSTFKGWRGGGCSGEATCVVAMDQDVSVTAVFKKRSKG